MRDKGKTLYLQAQTGISGDMFVAAMLDLGADPDVLRQVLDTLPQQGFQIRISRVKKAGIDCCDFDVVLEEELETHDHDMNYLYGHEHGHVHEADHEHTHSHDHETDHGHMHSHDHEAGHEHAHSHGHEGDHVHTHDHAHEHGHHHDHGHTHVHRTLADVREIIGRAAMTDGARELANRIFEVLAEAEAEAHGATKETVHFHEVGAVDSIVDIVSAAVCLDNLGIQEVVIPYICEGQGTVRTQHGILPIPVPAVTAISRANGLPLHIMETRGEFITPTGAAISAAIRTGGALPENMIIRRTGYGAGKRTYEIPSMLRAMLLEPAETEAKQSDVIWKLESNVDDCSGEVLGYVSDRLFAAGARDVHFTPVFMKKNRPAWQINVICTEDRIAAMEQILFRETTTIGVRRVQMMRTILKRRSETVQTQAGEVAMKICELDGGEKAYPEYDSVAALATETGRPFAEIFREAQEQYGKRQR